MGNAELVGYIVVDSDLVWTQIGGSVARLAGPWVTYGLRRRTIELYSRERELSHPRKTENMRKIVINKYTL